MDLFLILLIYLSGCGLIWVFTSPVRTRYVLERFGLAVHQDLVKSRNYGVYMEGRWRGTMARAADLERIVKEMEKEFDRYADAQDALLQTRPIGMASISLSEIMVSHIDDHLTLRTSALGRDFSVSRREIVMVRDLPSFLAAIRRKLLREWTGALEAEIASVFSPEGLAKALDPQRVQRRGTR